MTAENSITCWIGQLKAGDRDAVGPVWQRYFTRLVALARRNLPSRARRAGDGEDVALSALDSCFRGLEQGRFSQLLDRESLWRLLVVITERKARKWLRDQGRQKRGGGRVVGESALDAPAGSSSVLGGLAGMPDPEPEPELAVAMAEECQRLLGLLDPTMRQIALLKMEGFTNKEVAAQLGRPLRTIERKLEVIRALWEPEIPATD